MKKILLLIVTIFCLTNLTGCNSESEVNNINENSIYSKYQVNAENNVNSKKYETYIELTYDEYTKKIANNESFIILLYQTGCSHCEAFEPKLNEIITYYNLEIYALNLADLSEKEYSSVKNKTFVSGTPTTVYIKEGKYNSKMVGDKDEQSIIEFLVESNYLEEK